MALSLAKDYISHAFRKCGQMRPGYTLPPELLTDGLNEWQLMFDEANTRRTMAFTRPDYIYSVTGPGHGAIASGQTLGGTGYQIGPGAPDFNGPRPNRIVRMNLYMTSVSPTEPTRIPIRMLSLEEWADIPVLQLTAINVAIAAYYDPQFSTGQPWGVIWVWPPLNGNSLEIFTDGFLTAPASLTAAYTAPFGYQNYVVMSLAARLWPMCTKSMMANKASHQWICGQAAIARAQVMQVNARSPRLAGDFQSGPGSNGAVCDWNLLLTGVS